MDKLIPIEIKVKRVATSYELRNCNYGKKPKKFPLFCVWIEDVNTYNKIIELGSWYIFN